MKKIALVLLMFAAATNIYAQQEDDVKTLISGDMKLSADKIGFFLAPMFGQTTMDGGAASILNLRGGLTYDDSFAFGLYAGTSLNQIMPVSETVPDVYMDYWSVGGFAEYTLFARRVVHLTFPVYIGYGEVQMDNEVGDAGLGEANFMQVEPSALLEVNIHKYVRFQAGAGYRWVSDMTYRNFDQTAISGITGYVGLKIGLFN